MKRLLSQVQTSIARIRNHPSTIDTSSTGLQTLGYVDRRTYWCVFLFSLLMLAFMGMLISRGALAMGGVLPVPLRLTARHSTISNVSIRTALSPQGSYILITRADLDADDLTLSQVINLPVVGFVTLQIHADHATIHGLTSESLLLPTPSSDISFPTALVNSFDLQHPTISLLAGNVNSNGNTMNSH